MIQDRKQLTKGEKKIYDAIMFSFPKTKKETALDHAVAGGTNHQLRINF